MNQSNNNYNNTLPEEEDDVETAALLAELRAISMQSASSSRFREKEHDVVDTTTTDDVNDTHGTVAAAATAAVTAVRNEDEENDNNTNMNTTIPNDIRIPIATTTTTMTTTSSIPPNNNNNNNTATMMMMMISPSSDTMTTESRSKTPPPLGTTTTTITSPYRSTTPPVSSSPTKKNSTHVSILQRHSPHLRRKNSCSPVPQQQPPIPIPIPNNSNDDASGVVVEEEVVVVVPTRGRFNSNNIGSTGSSTTIRSAPSDERSVSPVKQPAKTATTTTTTMTTTSTATGTTMRNGGTADDAEWLALLRGSSSASSSTSRFDTIDTTNGSNYNTTTGRNDGGGVDDNEQPTTTTTNDANEQPTITETATAAGGGGGGGDVIPLPPWKRKRNQPPAGRTSIPKKTETIMENDVVEMTTTTMTTITTVGDVAVPKPDDNVGNNVASADRITTTTTTTIQNVPVVRDDDNHNEKSRTIPFPSSSSLLSSSSSSTFTYQGERGGSAEDAELLALLRGISSASSSTNRFDDDDDTDNQMNTTTDSEIVVPTPQYRQQPQPQQRSKTMTAVVPPWKQKRPTATASKSHATNSSNQDEDCRTNADIIIDTQQPPANDVERKQGRSEQQQPPPPPPLAAASSTFPGSGKVGGKLQSDIVSKPYQGERGGSAEDAELLALLRGISSTSSSTNRFDDDDDDTHHDNNSNRNDSKTNANDSQIVIPTPHGRQPHHQQRSNTTTVVVPPWKQQRPTAAASNHQSNTTHLPKQEAEGRMTNVDVIDGTQQQQQPATGVVQQQGPSEQQQPPPLTESSSSMGGKLHSDIVSKPYQGERGGIAEDAELLALLRGISSTTMSKDRFHDDVEDLALDRVTMARVKHENPTAQQQVPMTLLPSATIEASANSTVSEPVPTQEQQQQIDDFLPIESISMSIGDKNWKVRCQAYDTLSHILRDHVENRSNSNNNKGTVDSDVVLPGLDDQIHKFVEDMNASALDKALELCNLYAEHCSGAGRAEIARRIVASMIQKNCFSSRPTTLKLSNALTLKLMEVGVDNNNASVHSIIDVLLMEGLASKKPKVLQASASLILDATYHFGATSLPLAAVTNAAPKMLSHSNAIVRDCCIKVLAEICRALGGSKAPIQNVVDNMKKAQLSDLDTQLTEQPDPTPIRTGLRCQRRCIEQGGVSNSAPAADAIAALQANAKELEIQRFAARNSVDILAAIGKTDYAEQIVLSKWSEKVAALDKVLECGGEKPYKLMVPSSHVNYGPLVTEMKKLLAHTHFVVCSRAIQVLSMLAQGVGEKLYPHLRPTLTPLLQLSKDKKLTTEVSNGLDALFGNVLSFDSILDNDDAVPSMVDEKVQKNALARATAVSYLQRCVERQASAGPKGILSPSSAVTLATLCCNKLDDSDASVRKVALSVLESLLRQSKDTGKSISSNVEKVIEQLRSSNPRAYKTLSSIVTSVDTKGSTSSNSEKSAPFAEQQVEKTAVHAQPAIRSRSAAPPKRPPSPAAPRTDTVSNVSIENPMIKLDVGSASEDRSNVPRLEEAMVHITNLLIPQWDASEDDGGILAGLKASKWQLRHDAIELLRSFVESGGVDKTSSDVDLTIASILLVVREQTRGFRETNVNIMKAILNFCISICEFNESKEKLLPSWAMQDMACTCVQKISDRKLMHACQRLLSAVAVVSSPLSVLQSAFVELKTVKSPVAHEEFLKWFQSFCDDFGASVLGRGLSDLIPYLIEELGSLNAKVKRESFSCFAILHRQIGPALKSLVLALVNHPSTKDQLQKCFDENPFDPLSLSIVRARSSIVRRLTTHDDSGDSVIALEIPTLDLLATLPTDIISKLASKEGKTAWKMRKEGLDEIELSLKGCNGLLASGPAHMKQLIELTRGLRDRLTDLQINLRPTAARQVGTLVSLVDSTNQAKLCKVVLAALINEAMNDIKKPMRDASLLAIKSCITSPQLAGGTINVLTIDPLLSALISEVNEASIRAGGLPDLLALYLSVIESLPSYDCIATSGGQPLGDKYAAVLIDCLTSSKSETRSASLSLLEASLEKGVVGTDNIKKATDRLKPALQRSVGPMIAKMAKKRQLAKPPEEINAATSIIERTQSTLKHLDIRPRIHSKDKMDVSKTQMQGCSADEHSPSKTTSSLPLHPLTSDPSKVAAGITRSIIWTEYPEEPHGSVLENLKRSWAPLLPPSTVTALFPSSGIRKQDDAKAGIEVITRALSIDRSSGGTTFIEQLDFLLKWLMFALCSKESTTGLVEILALWKELFDYLLHCKRELTDVEAQENIPLLLDKASGAKGRFRDAYMEITSLLESEILLPPKRLGMVCIAVIDSSPHAKAKAQACISCLSCIEKTGLSGFGKKGVLATARMLSQDTTMHRMAALDLMESILLKMNGDLLRLARICGPSLSEKGQQLLEERWYKNHSKDIVVSSFQSGSPGTRPLPLSPQKTSLFGFQKEEKQSDLVDELPRLALRAAGKEPSRQSPRKVIDGEVPFNEHFAFSFDAGTSNLPIHTDPNLAISTTGTAFRTFNSMDVEPSGAAALLRARLQKIREKSNLPENYGSASTGDDLQNIGHENEPIDFDVLVKNIECLLSIPTRISESDSFMANCIDALKIVHSAISKQSSTSVGPSRSQLDAYRDQLLQNVNQVVELLRRLIGFSLKSGSDEVNSGMLLPLLSLCLAILMALFRDNEFAVVVAADELTLLLRETGSALLDARLSASDEASNDTRSQMVRAINKLAVQAATSSARHTSLQALLNLQQQLKESNDATDEIFRSRLSRVIVKLFARVVKAEESVVDPYVQGRIDMEALICSLEDILACNENIIPSNDTDVTIEMITLLLQSILTIQGSASLLRSLMEELGIDPYASALGKILYKCNGGGDVVPVVDTDLVNRDAPTKMTPSKDVASLVSRLGCAPPGDEREAALESIRAYKLGYGGKELDVHLQQLSGPFRDFIVEQINRDPSPVKQMNSSMSNDNATSGSVSDRIRSLRSRLQASEMSSVSKVTYERDSEKIQDEEVRMDQPPSSNGIESQSVGQNIHALVNTPQVATVATNSSPSEASSYSNTTTGTTSGSIVAPSPSKLPSIKAAVLVAESSLPPSTTTSTTVAAVAANNNNNSSRMSLMTSPESKIPLPGRQSRLPSTMSSTTTTTSSLSVSAQSLRERLAARQGTGSAMTNSATTIATTLQPQQDEEMTDNNNYDFVKSSTTTSLSSMGRAAALRARLEVVKQQQSSSNNNQ